MTLQTAQWIPWLPGLAAVLCGVCCFRPTWRRFAGPICVLSILAGFLITCGVYRQVPQDGDHRIVEFFDWIRVGGLDVGFNYFFDPLTLIMLFVITGMGTLIATYAMGYMRGEAGYARFFAGVALFIFAMTNLVMADNLLLLYLGWEGVGLCSYLLIGYYHRFPVAVNAAKKAFIVNRIGDLGFALGIFLTYLTFGSLNYEAIIPAAEALLTHDPHHISSTAEAAYEQARQAPEAWLHWIPFLLMLGAFGKSAQLPLHVWLPDAMAGPTPVSALIHAATMVTAGVFMIARLTPIFELSPYALPTVAIIGAVTCLFAATIAMCNCDLKGVFAYSTVSQLGYMFIGVGAISVGAVFHLFTHAFFKALLFLTAGSVMHALAGTLDIRAMSGMGRKMPATKWLMFAGCLALAGFPLTSGFFSKDLILGDTLARAFDHGPFARWYGLAAVLGLITAALTAFYSFRLWFRVFTGAEHYSYNGDQHEPDNDLERAMIAVGREHLDHTDNGHDDDHKHEPHEMPWWPMNLPLVILAAGSLLFGWWASEMFGGSGWISHLLHGSTQFREAGHGHAAGHHGEGLDPHHLAMGLSIALAVAGIAAAWLFHGLRRDLTQTVVAKLQPAVNLLYHKYWVDEIYDRVIVKPLRALAYVCYYFDQLVIDGLVMLCALLPRLTGHILRPAQSGRLQGYGAGMAFGVAVILLLIFYATTVE